MIPLQKVKDIIIRYNDLEKELSSGNLDSKSSKELLAFMKSVVDELNQTIIMVTHDPFAASFAQRVIMLKDGKVASDLDGPTQEEIVSEVTALTSI